MSELAASPPQMVAQAPVCSPQAHARPERAHAQARWNHVARALCLAWMVPTVDSAPHWPCFQDPAPVWMCEVPQPGLEPTALMSDAVLRLAPHFQAYPMFDRDPTLTLTDRQPDDLGSR